MGDLTRNFSRIEYTCKCGCGTYIDSLHIAKEDQILRDWISVQEGRDYPMVIHRGCSCPSHNENVGGVDGSRHLPKWYKLKKGASDKHMRGMSNWKFRRYLKKAYKLNILRGGVGLYRWGGHTDCSSKRRWGHFWSK